MSSIIISRTPALTLIFAKMDVYVDGQLRGRLAYGECLKVPVESGKHEVTVGETITMSEVHLATVTDDERVFFTIDFDNSLDPRYWLVPLELFEADSSEQSCSRCGDFAASFYEYNAVMCGPCLELFLEPDARERIIKVGAFIVLWSFLALCLAFFGCIVYAWLV
ncbi:MAG: hypothetical protein P1V97_36605 [Planctomycetota bacterium]|nr:hypothetical protein [Planctomycetota bacterium]